MSTGEETNDQTVEENNRNEALQKEKEKDKPEEKPFDIPKFLVSLSFSHLINRPNLPVRSSEEPTRMKLRPLRKSMNIAKRKNK
jgi:hypothetical protein